MRTSLPMTSGVPIRKMHICVCPRKDGAIHTWAPNISCKPPSQPSLKSLSSSAARVHVQSNELSRESAQAGGHVNISMDGAGRRRGLSRHVYAYGR
ncbi:hypothetical protein IQ07DRAFT_118505 [Pyrenochaeta sp. DS3sAY3a]|nr:hypothetical protein IQ07DRAFT_118505 [Pyrenochaeta sp. DS3sAY3a]